MHKHPRGTDQTIGRGFLLALVFVAFSRPTEAQRASHFEILSTPPADVGSCLPPRQTPAEGRTSKRLVMKSVEPGSSREIHVSFDRSGQPALYYETASAMKRAGESEGATVSAFFVSGGLTGFRTATAMTVPDSVIRSGRPAAVREFFANTSPATERRALDSTDQRKVRVMADFIRRRCP
jgi:hypothetical protein